MLLPAIILGTLGILALSLGSKKSAPSALGASPLSTNVGDPRNPLNLLPDQQRSLAAQAVATNDAGTLRQVAAQLDAQGFGVQANLLREQANLATAMKDIPATNALPDQFKVLIAQALAALTVDDQAVLRGPITAQGIQIASNIAGQLDSAGFTQAATDLRTFINRAQAALPPPPPDKSLPLPGLDPQLVTQMNQILQTERDPKKLRAAIAILQGLPQTPQRDQFIAALTTLADQIDASNTAANTMNAIQQAMQQAGVVTQSGGIASTAPGSAQPAPPVPPVPGIPVVPMPGGPITATPAAKTKQQIKAEAVASGLKRLQDAAGGNVKAVQGKEDKSGVMSFQAQESLTADGKAGPKTTLAFAKYTGDIPLVMYWPQGTTSKGVLDYRVQLNALADAADNVGDSVRANGLRNAALLERGQGGIVGPMPA